MSDMEATTTTTTDNNNRPWVLRVWNPVHENWDWDQLAKSSYGSQKAAAKKAASLLGAETSSSRAVANGAGGWDFPSFTVTAVRVLHVDDSELGEVVA